MKLYYSPGACSLADHIALIESGLPFETEKVDLKTKKTETGTDFSVINPKGYVPALGLEDGGVLTENVAILSYVADRSDMLVPIGGLGRFRALEALAYISTELHKGFKPFFMPNSSEDDKAAARETLTKRFALFEQALDGQEYALGDTFTVADCYLFVMLFWATGKVGLDFPSNLTNYFERMLSRDSIKTALKSEGLQ